MDSPGSNRKKSILRKSNLGFYNRPQPLQSDVFAFAITLWEIFSHGKRPYDDIPNAELIQKVLLGYRMEIPQHWPKVVRQILSDCWMHDPKQRPTFAEIFKRLDEVSSDMDPPQISVVKESSEEEGEKESNHEYQLQPDLPNEYAKTEGYGTNPYHYSKKKKTSMKKTSSAKLSRKEDVELPVYTLTH